MTVETKMTLELNDVTAIEFECNACHARTTLSITNFRNPPMHCSLCQNPQQWFIGGDRDYSDIVALGRVIQWFSGAERPKGFVMRLHITNPSASGRVASDRA
jgi:hypothetical protein